MKPAFSKVVFSTSLISMLMILGMVLAYTELVSAQTIPTRTPTPAAVTPTSDPGDPGPGPTAPPGPTATAPSSTAPAATATQFVLPPTPVEGYLPTAEPCSASVTARATISNLNVRAGPGLSYDILGSLLFNEVRPVIGRAPQATWWQIILADGANAWVADQFVDVTGYTGLIPTVEPPLLGDLTVTPGTPWAPTPWPECTPPPTATGTATATPSATASPTADHSTPTSEASPTPTTAAVELPATEAVATPSATPAPTALPLEDEAPAAGSDLWIPLVAAGFIVAAGIALLLRRRGH